MPPDPRVIFYSHDSVGLGHLRRSLSVAAAVTRRAPRASALCITGSPAPTLFEVPERCDILKLPCLGKNDNGDYSSLRLALTPSELGKMRGELLLAAARAFQPNLLLVDHTPLGPNRELLPMLRWLRTESRRTRVVLGLRDIIDSPARARAAMDSDRTVDVLRETYDEILVYGQRDVFDVGRAYDLPQDVCDKTAYVGFVCPQVRGARRARPAGLVTARRWRIVACAGGGQDGFLLQQAVVRGVREGMPSQPVELVVVTGPLMPAHEVRVLRRLAESDARIRVVSSTREMPRLVAGADLVIGMAGYNSVYECLQRGRRLLVAPRVHPRLEQHERARLLAERGYLAVVPPDAFGDPSAMASLVRRVMVAPATPAQLDFDGAERAAGRLLAGLEQTCNVG